jgi:hypothetical protein
MKHNVPTLNFRPSLPLKIGLFTFSKTIFRNVQYVVCCCLFKLGPTRDEKVYNNGVKKLNKDINLIDLVETIKKLKAVAQVLIGNDPRMVQKICCYYHEQVELSDTSTDEEKKKIVNRPIIEFLSRSEKEFLRNQEEKKRLGFQK